MINEAFADVLVEGDACGQTAIQAGLTSPLAVIIVPLPGSPPYIHRLNKIVVHGFLLAILQDSVLNPAKYSKNEARKSIMMKLLYLTDTHIRGSNPRNRTDDFPATLRAKLQEVAQIAAAEKADAILHGGDLFDLPTPELPLVADCIRILMSAEIPIYAVAGNHDMYAFSPDTLDRTMLGFLHNLGIIRLLQPGKRLYLSDDRVRIQLTGQHFHHAVDRRDPVLDYCVDKLDCDFAVHMAHGMLLNKPFFRDTPHTLIKQVAPFTEADVTLGSHAHFGYPEVRVGGKLFINPGSIVRLSHQPADINRIPRIVVLEFGPTGLAFRYIPLQSARPGREVIDLSGPDVSRAREKCIVGLAGTYEDGAIGRDLKGALDDVSEKRTVSRAVRDEALRLIDKYRRDTE
ncbi:MAG: metallophosphoesterase family protein [Eubacteriales bacterium]|jgi:predicted phosphodiesterase|nr:metallophosphoesterase family protein [Bacillota bacterium]MBV1727594.1 metallophosphoesterase family protein [Desulforudis sp.]MDP3049891.1 metallophosphoesterase family protein [Eubacteriales bacterium]MBU4532839.1 metallophosphoesterase family protein [Bacillota bacterium]MBU4553984.1 metallophosphoesterase family protein [Bacillota bacterium]